jgi:hypothetical protein
VVAVLEGGYCPHILRKVVPAIIGQMSGYSVKLRGRIPFLDLSIQKQAEKNLKTVKRIQASFWKL